MVGLERVERPPNAREAEPCALKCARQSVSHGADRLLGIVVAIHDSVQFLDEAFEGNLSAVVHAWPPSSDQLGARSGRLGWPLRERWRQGYEMAHAD
jgi:hypothetical protein